MSGRARRTGNGTVLPARPADARPRADRNSKGKLAGKLPVGAKRRRESAAERKERTAAICRGLAAAYPDAHCELNYRNPLELLIATILSAQCTDKRVNMVTEELFQVCRTAADYVAIPQEHLETIIKSTGFFRAKAKNIKACCADLVDKHGGEVPSRMEELTQLAGVGRKTANVVLGNVFGMNEGIVVDTHVQRLSNRLGLTAQTAPERIEQELMPLVPREQWTIFSHWLIWHGRRRCFARKPDCPGCEIAGLCPSAGKLGVPLGRVEAV